MSLKGELAKYQMALYCKSKGWEVDDWDDLPKEVQGKYLSEADHIHKLYISHLPDMSDEEILAWARENGYYSWDLLGFKGKQIAIQAYKEKLIKERGE